MFYKLAYLDNAQTSWLIVLRQSDFQLYSIQLAADQKGTLIQYMLCPYIPTLQLFSQGSILYKYLNGYAFLKWQFDSSWLIIALKNNYCHSSWKSGSIGAKSLFKCLNSKYNYSG